MLTLAFLNRLIQSNCFSLILRFLDFFIKIYHLKLTSLCIARLTWKAFVSALNL